MFCFFCCYFFFSDESYFIYHADLIKKCIMLHGRFLSLCANNILGKMWLNVLLNFE